MGGSLRLPPIFLSLALAAVVLFPADGQGNDLFLSEEPEIYAAVDKLQALGYLPGFLANTRPYSMEQIRAAAEAASRNSLPEAFDGELLRWLEWYSAPKAMGRGTIGLSHSRQRFVAANNDGIPTPEGWAAEGRAAGRLEPSPYFSAQARGAVFRGEGGDDGGRLLDTSIEAGYRYASVQAGKLSTWYGPGRHGALVFTNNAAPYPGVRIHNPRPIPLSGWFSFLGSVQYDFFAARMEKRERFSHSMLVGTRLAARPAPWLEIGLSRALHYGGEGRGNGLSEFWTGFRGHNGTSDADRNNTLAGYDVTLTLPFRVQPVQAYLERVGEGDNRLLGTGIPWPSQWGNIFGLYFPKILGESRLDLRAEYADNFSGTAKTAQWYNHAAYPHTYRGEVLGHPMGGDSIDWFFESRLFFLPSTFATVSYERLRHEKGLQPQIVPPGERHSIVSAGLVGWLAKSWRGEAHAALDRVATRGGVPGRDGRDFSAWLGLSRQLTF